uniref:Uncharacterized protein n=1 Tax=Opuntia streptacantha TaxID=393608 RepID=A0A7C9DHW9_OPUST
MHCWISSSKSLTTALYACFSSASAGFPGGDVRSLARDSSNLELWNKLLISREPSALYRNWIASLRIVPLLEAMTEERQGLLLLVLVLCLFYVLMRNVTDV